MSNIEEVLEIATTLHPGLTERAAKDEEISREMAIHSAVIKVTRALKDFIATGKTRGESEPERYLKGELCEMYTRSLCGHGTETQGLNHLMFHDIVIDQEFQRMADPYTGYKRSEVELVLTGDAVDVRFNYLQFYPKQLQPQTEGPGYYSGRVRLSRDTAKIEEVLESSRAYYRELQAVRGSLNSS